MYLLKVSPREAGGPEIKQLVMGLIVKTVCVFIN